MPECRAEAHEPRHRGGSAFLALFLGFSALPLCIGGANGVESLGEHGRRARCPSTGRRR